MSILSMTVCIGIVRPSNCNNALSALRSDCICPMISCCSFVMSGIAGLIRWSINFISSSIGRSSKSPWKNSARRLIQLYCGSKCSLVRPCDPTRCTTVPKSMSVFLFSNPMKLCTPEMNLCFGSLRYTVMRSIFYLPVDQGSYLMIFGIPNYTTPAVFKYWVDVLLFDVVNLNHIILGISFYCLPVASCPILQSLLGFFQNRV